MRLVGQLAPTLDRARISSQQNIDQIFVLFDLAFHVGDRFRCGVNQLFRLPHIDQRRRSILLQRLFQLQRILARGQSLFRNLQLEIEGAKFEVGSRYI